MQKLATFLLVLAGLWIGAPHAALAIPTDELLKSLRPSSDVSDFAGLLTPDEKATLESRCRELREKTGAQLAVVTLKSLEGGQIDDFANKLFARWGVGQKDKKNGLLLIVAMDERKSRVEVGYGLEPIIPDVLAGRILDHQLRPRFRQKQYAEGLTAAADALIELVEKGEPPDREALAAEQGGGGSNRAFVLALAIFVGAGAIVAGAGLGSKTFPAIAFGTFFGGVPGAIGIALGGLLAALFYLPVALAGGAFGWYAARHTPSPKSRSGRSGTPWTWDWGNVSSGGGTWSSGGGGGGFSQDWGGFGGGSSGGGGASSNW